MRHYYPGTEGTPSELLALIKQSLDDDKAGDIVTIDLEEQGALADYMVVASGTSTRHVIAMAEKLRDRLSQSGHRGLRMQGEQQGDWVVIDAGDVIVHLFRPEVRDFYAIEKMWTSRKTAGPSSTIHGMSPVLISGMRTGA